MDSKVQNKLQILMREALREDRSLRPLGYSQMFHIRIQVPQMSSASDLSIPLQTTGHAKEDYQKLFPYCLTNYRQTFSLNDILNVLTPFIP